MNINAVFPNDTIPLEGGGKRVGVKGLTGIARRLRKNPLTLALSPKGRGKMALDNTFQ